MEGHGDVENQSDDHDQEGQRDKSEQLFGEELREVFTITSETGADGLLPIFSHSRRMRAISEFS